MNPIYYVSCQNIDARSSVRRQKIVNSTDSMFHEYLLFSFSFFLTSCSVDRWDAWYILRLVRSDVLLPLIPFKLFPLVMVYLQYDSFFPMPFVFTQHPFEKMKIQMDYWLVRSSFRWQLWILFVKSLNEETPVPVVLPFDSQAENFVRFFLLDCHR